MLKTLVVLAAGVAVLSASGCCWPVHPGRGGHHGGYGRSEDRPAAPRPAPPRHAAPPRAG